MKLLSTFTYKPLRRHIFSLFLGKLLRSGVTASYGKSPFGFIGNWLPVWLCYFVLLSAMDETSCGFKSSSVLGIVKF